MLKVASLRGRRNHLTNKFSYIRVNLIQIMRSLTFIKFIYDLIQSLKTFEEFLSTNNKNHLLSSFQKQNKR